MSELDPAVALKQIRDIADGRRHYRDAAGGEGCFDALGEIRELCDQVLYPRFQTLVDALTQDRESPHVALAAVHAILTYELRAAIERPMRNKMYERRLNEGLVATSYAMQFIFTKPDGSPEMWHDIDFRAKKVLGLPVLAEEKR